MFNNLAEFELGWGWYPGNCRRGGLRDSRSGGTCLVAAVVDPMAAVAAEVDGVVAVGGVPRCRPVVCPAVGHSPGTGTRN